MTVFIGERLHKQIRNAFSLNSTFISTFIFSKNWSYLLRLQYINVYTGAIEDIMQKAGISYKVLIGP